jgi:hypothetical protein
MKIGNITLPWIYICNLCWIICTSESFCCRETGGLVEVSQWNFARNDFIRTRLRGGRSKRGGKRVKAALEDALQRGSNSTAGARFPIGKWAKSPNATVNQTKILPESGFRAALTPWKKKKPLSNRQLANQARSKHRSDQMSCNLIRWFEFTNKFNPQSCVPDWLSVLIRASIESIMDGVDPTRDAVVEDWYHPELKYLRTLPGQPSHEEIVSLKQLNRCLDRSIETTRPVAGRRLALCAAMRPHRQLDRLSGGAIPEG